MLWKRECPSGNVKVWPGRWLNNPQIFLSASMELSGPSTPVPACEVVRSPSLCTFRGHSQGRKRIGTDLLTRMPVPCGHSTGGITRAGQAPDSFAPITRPTVNSLPGGVILIDASSPKRRNLTVRSWAVIHLSVLRQVRLDSDTVLYLFIEQAGRASPMLSPRWRRLATIRFGFPEDQARQHTILFQAPVFWVPARWLQELQPSLWNPLTN